MEIKKFDNNKFYLGKLCPQGHCFDNTGKSLRYKNNWNCKQCCLSFYADNKEEILKKKAESYTALSKYRVRKYKKHPNETARLRYKKKRHYERIKNNPILWRKKMEAIKRAQQKQRDCLADYYLKRLIRKTVGLKFTKITKDIINLKREQLCLSRLLNQLKKGDK